MQKQMVSEFIFLPVPAEQLAEAEINVLLPMQYYASGGKLVVENVKNAGEIVCDGDCGGCPMSEVKYGNNEKCKYNRKKRGESGV